MFPLLYFAPFVDYLKRIIHHNVYNTFDSISRTSCRKIVDVDIDYNMDAISFPDTYRYLQKIAIIKGDDNMN